MVTKKQISEVMRVLGKRTSPRKAETSRLNGKKGGRPRSAQKNAGRNRQGTRQA